eukprot:CAMPEP_0116850690 /NCGR_PEP_ID=MMETSP0418-20121206/16298_1 /TAXON_ID=1158023 /ORGANISM="Astrosyne radiata, Strain 13vi08-1A" /LENGTH=148 /DNA_ID=CAMNT_0004482611 /DNA_START=61 /DNA_END=504 /DNA_ORIENTATION=-
MVAATLVQDDSVPSAATATTPLVQAVLTKDQEQPPPPSSSTMAQSSASAAATMTTTEVPNVVVEEEAPQQPGRICITIPDSAPTTVGQIQYIRPYGALPVRTAMLHGLGRDPVIITCPRCQVEGRTRVVRELDTMAIFAALILFVVAW